MFQKILVPVDLADPEFVKENLSRTEILFVRLLAMGEEIVRGAGLATDGAPQ